MDTTTPSPFIVRRAVVGDLPKIREYLSSSTTKICLPHPTKCEMELFVTPPDVPLSWHEERLFVVEEAEKVIGHFFLWNADDRHKWVQVIAAFEGSCSEGEVVQAAKQFFAMLFEQKKVHRIMFLMQPDQIFFFNVARQLKLLFEGTLRKHIALDGHWYDVSVFAALATDEDTRMREKLPKGKRYDWLIPRAKYDEVEVFVVRAIVLKMLPTSIEVLLLKRASTSPLPGAEETPGGKMKEGETIQEALAREVKEKIGVDIEEDISFLTSFDFTCTDGKRVREFVFRVHPLSLDISVKGDEYDSYCWLPLQDLPATKLHPDLIQILSSYSPTISYESEGCPVHEEDASIELLRPPSLKLEQTLLDGLHLDAYATRGLGLVDSAGLSLRDGSNRVVGGLVFEIGYGCLHLRRMWVDPEWRRLGWGRKLILRAESMAKEKGCAFSMGIAMDWEDVSFFQRLGYFIEGTIPGYDKDSRGLWIRKEL
jgi:8-oxo-dGTP pyrophosphatase MutT (NUDIX family)/GNAT superfamily N-acetyltransferase